MSGFKKTVLFTGAGAVVPWGARKTWEITELIRQDRVYRSIRDQPLGDWLYEMLAAHYHQDKDSVNFETILNALEYLITFYWAKDLNGRAAYKNVMPAFFEDKEDFAEIMDFDGIYQKNQRGWQSEPLPNEFYSFWADRRTFSENVYRRFINIIIKEVQRYSNAVGEHAELNGLLKDFLLSRRGILRCYTTNYDRIIPDIFKGDLFEGFTEGEGMMKFDPGRVLLDEEVDTYYNLHGSAHYDLDFPGNVKLQKDKCVSDFGSGSSSVADQDSRILYHSNIISGFNKTGRILANPFSQFYHRFYQDCLTADELFIIGYSFGDIHLNKAMRNAIEANKKLRLTAIDYLSFPGEDFEVSNHDWLNPNRKLGKIFGATYHIWEVTKIEDGDRVGIYRKGFERFLRRREWQSGYCSGQVEDKEEW